MPEPIEIVTPSLLREWGLPEPGASKYDRGQVVVVGGAAGSPGAAMLTALAALRVGAGRLTLAVDARVAPHVAVAVPESGVVPWTGEDLSAAADELAGADVVAFGPGLDDAEHATAMLRALPGLIGDRTNVLLDAFGLGALAEHPDLAEPLAGRLIMTPNHGEVARLLGREPEELADDVAELAGRFGAVVSCFDVIAAPDGRRWRSDAGGPGLATSGSGDVLAGAIAGFAARGAPLEQAAVWGTHVHGVAGTRLAATISPLGYLASELLAELPKAVVEVG